jgi:protocatechuate 3,4-dioxygenase, alpha subunit
MTESRPDLIATPSQTVGPFFAIGTCAQDGLGRLAGPGARGERISLSIQVLDGEGQPVADSMIELWQADADGKYGVDRDFSGFGRLASDASGRGTFETIRPGPVARADGPAEAAHVNVCLFMRGLLRHVYTRVYFAGDPALSSDPVLSLVPLERRPTLLAHPVSGVPGAWAFEIRLQGAHETVFFDL